MRPGWCNLLATVLAGQVVAVPWASSTIPSLWNRGEYDQTFQTCGGSNNRITGASSLPGGFPKDANRVIINTDIPDPDNFFMIREVINNHPEIQVDVIISPRALDLSAIPIWTNFVDLMKGVGVSTLLNTHS